MPNDEPTKEGLEREKLSAEIALLRQQQEQAPKRAAADIAKAEAEAASLHRPFYENPTFYTSLLPVFAAIIGLIITWGSGWFSVQTDKLEVRRDLLQLEAAKLSSLSNVLTIQVSVLTNELSNLRYKQDGLVAEAAAARAALTSANAGRADLETAYKKTVSELAGVQTERDNLRTEVARLQKDLSSAAQWRSEASQVLNKPVVLDWNHRGGRPVADAEKNRLKALLNKVNPGDPSTLQRNNSVIDKIFDYDRD